MKSGSYQYRQDHSAVDQDSYQCDGELASRGAAGDDHAIEELLQRYEAEARRYARSLTSRSGGEIDEIIQESFISAWTNIAKLKDPKKFRPWFFRIIKFKSIDDIRKRREIPIPDISEVAATGAQDPEKWMILTEGLAQVNHHLKTNLSEKQSQCWQLRFVHNLSYAQISNRTDLTLATVRGNIARSRTKMNELINDCEAA